MFLFRLFVIALCCLILPAPAQILNGANAYIFDQSYVTRIPAALADTMAEHNKLIDQWRNSNWTNQHKEKRPPEVKRQGKRLTIQGNSTAPLILQSYVYRGNRDSRDSQIFTYLQTLKNYHLLGVEFSHDEPHFLLVERSTLKTYFVDFDKD